MKRYFVTGIHRAADANAMERSLVEAATAEFLYHIVPEERLEVVAERIRFHQENILHFRPRLKTVKVELNPVFEFTPDHRSISIGSSQMNFQEIKGEIL